MSIWGRRGSEPPAGEAHESQSPAQAEQAQAPGEPGPEAEAGTQAEPGPQAEEPAPAFWRAQGDTAAPFGRSPTVGEPSAEAPPPAHDDVPDGAPEPAGGQAVQAPDDMVVLDGATAVKDPALTGTALGDAGMAGAEPAPGAQEPAVPEPVVPGPALAEAGAPDAAVTEAPGPAASGPSQSAGPPPQAAPADVPADAPGSHDGISAQRWSEIMVAFVDDPRGSVKMAAEAVGEAIDEFVNSVRTRQRALESSWHGTGTDTEQLRTALRDYRRFWHQVQQLNPAGKTGAAAGRAPGG